MTQEAPGTARVFTENLHAPETFAVEATSFAQIPGCISITLAAWRWDNAASPPVQHKVVVGRLVMPISGAQGLAEGLFDFLATRDLIARPSTPQN